MNLIFLSGILVLIIAFFMLKKYLSKLNDMKKYREKVLFEDALKYMFDCEFKLSECTIDSLKETLLINEETARQLIYKLEKLGLVTEQNNKVRLTDLGRENALKIVRIHRLLERYLAEKTNIKETEWHRIAEEKEHEIDIEDANKISIELGNPLLDPHGDPIPNEKGNIHFRKQIFLDELDEGKYAQILHIEDEPDEIFSVINSHKIYPDMKLKIIKKFKDEIIIEVEGREIKLSKEVAKNISVKEIEESNYSKINVKPLSSLKTGEIAEVNYLSKALRGEQRRRLLDLGIVPGTKIKPVLESIGKEPVAYEVRGTLIALRKNQAENIFVKEIK